MSYGTPEARTTPPPGRPKRSLWPMWAIFGAGMLTFVGFAYIAVRARNRTWALFAAAYFVVMIPIATFMPEDTESTSSDLYFGVLVVPFWAIGIVHSLITNRKWREWVASVESAAPTYTPPAYAPPAYAPPAYAPAPPTFVPPPPPPAASAVGADSSDFYGSGGAARPSPTAGGPAGVRPPALPRQVDINAASADDLRALPGFDESRVAKVLEVRRSRQSFTTVQEFADAAGLPPHEFVRIRGRLVCTPRKSPPRQGGHGRVLDV